MIILIPDTTLYLPKKITLDKIIFTLYKIIFTWYDIIVTQYYTLLTSYNTIPYLTYLIQYYSSPSVVHEPRLIQISVGDVDPAYHKQSVLVRPVVVEIERSGGPAPGVETDKDVVRKVSEASTSVVELHEFIPVKREYGVLNRYLFLSRVGIFSWNAFDTSSDILIGFNITGFLVY